MQRGELFAEQIRIAVRTQIEVLQHQIALPGCDAVSDGSRYADGVRRGYRV